MFAVVQILHFLIPGLHICKQMQTFNFTEFEMTLYIVCENNCGDLRPHQSHIILFA